MNTGTSRAGTIHFVTEDTVEDVLSFYEEDLKEKGLKVTTNTARQDGAAVSGTAAA